MLPLTAKHRQKIFGAATCVLLFCSVVYVGSGCATTSAGESDPYDESATRVYQEDSERVLELVARALVDIGLSIENAAARQRGSYVVNAYRLARMVEGETTRVASIDVFVEEVGDEGTRVKVVTDKISKTSMIGQSSAHRRDYARRLFRILDDEYSLQAISTGEGQALNGQ